MDNVETYKTTLSKANAYWMARISDQIYTRKPTDSAPDEDEILEGLDPITREEYLRNEQLRESLRRSANPNLVNLKKRSMYDSDTNGGHSVLNGDMNSTCKSSNMP
jgi:hypothetical protein